MRKQFVRLLAGRETKNAAWLIGGKVAQTLVSMIVGLLTARFLGPSNYGLINYGTAYVAFFASLSTLGINSVIIKDFVDHPEEQGKAVGTALLLRLCSGLLSVVTIFAIVGIVDGYEGETILVVVLCSLSLVFNVLETLNYWFQYIYQSKVTAITTFIAYIATALYKIVLLILKKDVAWFAFATSVDFIVSGLMLLTAYRKHQGPKFACSFQKAKQLLGKSYHYILSGMMVSIYAQTGNLLIKQMMTDADVGYYATATTLCSMWVFVLQAIIDAMYPTILRAYTENKQEFEKKNRQLYAIVFYVSVIVSIGFTVLGEPIVKILYGEAFLPAVLPLKIVTWYTAFSYLGVARNAWIVCENKQKYLKYMYVGAAVLNVVLNVLMIPVLGTVGAALASLFTQIFTSLILPLAFKDMRANTKLMIQGILLRKI